MTRKVYYPRISSVAQETEIIEFNVISEGMIHFEIQNADPDSKFDHRIQTIDKSDVFLSKLEAQKMAIWKLKQMKTMSEKKIEALDKLIKKIDKELCS